MDDLIVRVVPAGEGRYQIANREILATTDIPLDAPGGIGPEGAIFEAFQALVNQ